MIKAVVFDCFGVVVSDALQVIAEQLRASDAAAADELRDIIQASNRGLIEPQLASSQVADILGVSYEQYRQQIADGEIKNQELLEYIAAGLRPRYKTALLSNIGAGSLARRFEAAELERYFDVVVASGDIGFAKPEARAYEITAERLGVRLDECVFTDDRDGYCEGAQAVGMHAILFESNLQFRRDLEALLSRFGA